MNNFDKQVPLYADVLHKALTELKKEADGLFEGGHSCNCEFCDEDSDGEVPEIYHDNYNQIRKDAIEVQKMLDSVVRWAKFKGIKLRRPVEVYRSRWLIPEAID